MRAAGTTCRGCSKHDSRHRKQKENFNDDLQFDSDIRRFISIRRVAQLKTKDVRLKSRPSPTSSRSHSIRRRARAARFRRLGARRPGKKRAAFMKTRELPRGWSPKYLAPKLVRRTFLNSRAAAGVQRMGRELALILLRPFYFIRAACNFGLAAVFFASRASTRSATL